MYLCIFTILPCVWISLNLLNFFYFVPVTGDANFHIDSTSLTVGGFNQPSIARTLIEIPRNAEKGLSQRFLWMFPKPVCSKFAELEPIDESFYQDIGMYLDMYKMHIDYLASSL